MTKLYVHCKVCRCFYVYETDKQCTLCSGEIVIVTKEQMEEMCKAGFVASENQ